MTETRDYRLGLILVTASALAFSLAGILTKSVEANVWTTACWRGVIGGGLILAYVGWRGGEGAFRLGWRGWFLAAEGAVASLTFIWAFKLTYVANVVLIYATAPFLMAALGFWLLGERIRRSTAVAAAVAFAGVVIVAWGGIGGGAWSGNAMALLMTVLMALYLVLIRKFRDTPVVLAGGVSGLLLFVAGCLVVDPWAVAGTDIPLLIAFGASFAIAVVLWIEGTRLIPAAEAGLIGLAETPIAILLAWLLLAELPPAASLIGGAVVLAAVFGHAALDTRRRAGRYAR